MDLPRTVSLLHRKMSQALNDKLTVYGLTDAKMRILKLLYRKGQMTQGDIGTRLDMDKSTIAKIIARLEEKDLLTKLVNPDDTRSYLVSLTSAAEDLLPQALEDQDKWTDDVTSVLSPEEKDVFFASIDKLARKAAAIADRT